MNFTPRLNIITGRSGIGKTFILDVAWWSLTGIWARLPAAPRVIDEITMIEKSRGKEILGEIATIVHSCDCVDGFIHESGSVFNRPSKKWSGHDPARPVTGLILLFDDVKTHLGQNNLESIIAGLCELPEILTGDPFPMQVLASTQECSGHLKLDKKQDRSFDLH
jgi:hypothetical protein